MILEEVIEKLALRLIAIEQALKEKGLLDDDLITLREMEAKKRLPVELGEEIRALNNPDILESLRSIEKQQQQ